MLYKQTKFGAQEIVCFCTLSLNLKCNLLEVNFKYIKVVLKGLKFLPNVKQTHGATKKKIFFNQNE